MCDDIHMWKDIDASDVANSIKDFLNKYFAGCYIDEGIDIPDMYAHVSPYYLALCMRIIFRFDPSSKLLCICNCAKGGQLILRFSLSTAKLSRSSILQLRSAAKRGCFSVSINDNKIEMICNLYSKNNLNTNTEKTPIVYNVLCSVFEMFDYLKID